MPTTTNAPPLRTIEVADGPALAYRELGSGPPVLLLHGWPTSSLLWRNVMPVLAQRNRVLAVDLPGFGGSPKPPAASYDFTMFEGAIDGFLAALGLERIAIVGHDLGGPIAVRWAMTRPGRVTRLAMLNTLLYPEFSDAVIEFVVDLSTPVSSDRRTSDEGLTEIMRLGVADPARITDEVMAGVVAPYPTEETRRTLARAGIGLPAAGFAEIAAGLGSLAVPVRVVYGVDDRLLPDVADTMARLALDVPQAEITGIPGCGHFLQEDAPEQVAGLLAPFLALDSGSVA